MLNEFLINLSLPLRIIAYIVGIIIWSWFIFVYPKKEIKNIGENDTKKKVYVTSYNQSGGITANKIDVSVNSPKEFTFEKFKNQDLNKRVKVFSYPGFSNERAIIFFELENVPEKNSVEVSNERGVFSPATLVIENNIIALKGIGSPDHVFNDTIKFFVIKYIPAHFVSQKLYTVENMEYQIINKDDFSYTFNLKDSKKEKSLGKSQ
ncbi:MAG: hypothetical protein P9X22_00080 [Candidatus Zapsychrus exili]|nr:hypothetical protein [Candidatus Zapsychrus exili]